MVIIDFPYHKELLLEERGANSFLKEKFQIRKGAQFKRTILYPDIFLDYSHTKQ